MATLRVTAGSLRGRRVPVPAGETRPTSERARQGFFNIVGERIDAARFLDLFAGSGIFSFEAVSRGATSATAVDRKTEQITRLAAEWDVPVTAIQGDALTALPRLREHFDVVYADPPYDYHAYPELVGGISELSLAPGALVAIEHRKRTNPFTETKGRLQVQRRAEYGEVWITFFQVSGLAP